MKPTVLIATLFFVQVAQAQENLLDYCDYHKKINLAEEQIFLNNDSIGGLLTFDSVFQVYDFVFVDDCIEAFQLAILYKRDDLAMHFIKKAMDNGFSLNNFNGLDYGCMHNYFADKEKKVTIFNDFIKENRKKLELYEQKAYAKYLDRIDKPLLQIIINRHIKEQTNKNFIPAMGISIIEHNKIYREVLDDNLAFIVSKFKKGEYIGEKNVGILDKKLLKKLGIVYLNENNRLDTSILKKFNLPKGTYVPVKGTEENDYFDATPLYIMLYHNDNSFNALEKYKDDAIREGYLHPREYASLKLSGGRRRENRVNNEKMRLSNFFSAIENTVEINKLREAYLLPKYEVDLKKHEVAHKYNLRLFFGFFNGTR